jgi:hypothetical protein
MVVVVAIVAVATAAYSRGENWELRDEEYGGVGGVKGRGRCGTAGRQCN